MVSQAFTNSDIVLQTSSDCTLTEIETSSTYKHGVRPHGNDQMGSTEGLEAFHVGDNL